jgi:hypothetical protein
MEHPSIANQVLSNESQAILPTQHFVVVVAPSKGSDLWVIESPTGGLLSNKLDDTCYGSCASWQGNSDGLECTIFGRLVISTS